MKGRRAAHLRAGLRSRLAFWGMLAGTTFALIAGGSIRDWRVTLGGIALAGLVILVVAFVNARARAAAEFFGELAPQLGLEYLPGGHYVALTPLLAAGDARRFEHTMEGPLFGKLGGPPCLLGYYTFDTIREIGRAPHRGPLYPSTSGRVDFDHELARPHPFTVCAIDIGAPLYRFRGLYLRSRLSGLRLDHDWLAHAPRPERIELESARFDELYDLHRTRDQDELAVRELFSPSFVAWLADHPLRPGFECKAGTLVVFIHGHEESAGKIAMLHEAAREIARRLGRQVEQGGIDPRPVSAIPF